MDSAIILHNVDRIVTAVADNKAGAEKFNTIGLLTGTPVAKCAGVLPVNWNGGFPVNVTLSNRQAPAVPYVAVVEALDGWYVVPAS